MEFYQIDESCFSEKWDEKFYENAKYDSRYKIVEYFENNKRCGFAVIMNLVAESELIRLAVLPEYRRKGIAENLVKEVIEYSQKMRYENIFLEVRAGNSSARALYLKCGFEECGVRKGYYNNPKEDGVVMRKRLI